MSLCFYVRGEYKNLAILVSDEAYPSEVYLDGGLSPVYLNEGTTKYQTKISKFLADVAGKFAERQHRKHHSNNDCTDDDAHNDYHNGLYHRG